MKKETIVAIASSIAIISAVAYSAINYYAIENLNFRLYGKEKFSFYSISNGKLEACNTLPVPATLIRYDAEIIYQSNKLATFSTSGIVPPLSSAVLDGKLTASEFVPALTYLLYLDSELSGLEVARFDAKQLRVVTNMETRFLGVIPISITKEYSAYEFVSLMKQDDNSFGCQNVNQN